MMKDQNLHIGRKTQIGQNRPSAIKDTILICSMVRIRADTKREPGVMTADIAEMTAGIAEMTGIVLTMPGTEEMRAEDIRRMSDMFQRETLKYIRKVLSSRQHIKGRTLTALMRPIMSQRGARYLRRSHRRMQAENKD